jgi:transcriptional regulator with XRE-family HTH domain
MKTTSPLATKIRQLREAKGLTQSALAKAASVSERTIRRIEQGTETPSFFTLQAVAGALGVDKETLLRLAKNPPRPGDKVQIVPIPDGHALLNTLADSHAYTLNADNAEDEEVAALVREILDAVEWAEIWDELAPSARYDAGRQLSETIRRLESHSWAVCVVRRFGIQSSTGRIPSWITSELCVKKLDPNLLEQVRSAMSDSQPAPSDCLHVPL